MIAPCCSIQQWPYRCVNEPGRMSHESKWRPDSDRSKNFVKKMSFAVLALAVFLPLAPTVSAEDAKPQPAKPAAHPQPSGAKPVARPAKPAPKPGDAKPPEAKAAAVPAEPVKPPEAAAPQQPLVLDRATAIKRAEESLNSSAAMIADFVQIGGDGRRAEGKLYVQRVGRLRFEYAQPATMEIVADGVSVAVRDRKLNTQDLYFIGQTPLKFLLDEKVDLQKDVKVLDVVTDDSGTAITIEDKSTFGGTSKIKLIFDSKTFALKQWQVSDPQGYETLVSLFNIDRSRAPDPKLFKINQQRLLEAN